MLNAERQLLGLLRWTNLPVQNSYCRSEVCKILNISKRSFWSMITKYKLDPISGKPLDPASLDSYMLGRERRVTLIELVEYLKRNNTYDRKHAL